MYRINNLGRNVLITTDEVIFHAPTKHELDPRMIEQSIIIAEERFIVPALGYNYYEQLIGEKNIVVDADNKEDLEDADKAGTVLTIGQVVNSADELEDDNKALWNRILWKLLAECVIIAAYPEGFIQLTSSGIIHENATAGPLTGPGIITPDLKSTKWVMDKKMLDRINPLLEAMHVWICKQKKADPDKYPLYCKDCGCDHHGVPYQRRTDIILGIYDDQDSNTWNRRNPNKLPGCCD